MTDAYKPVVFENSAGEEISNDPVWLARKTLAQYGATDTDETTTSSESNESDDSDEDLDKPEDYKSFDGPGLKKLAAEKGVDITGLKKVGEVREALVKHDADAKAAAEVEAANQTQE